MISRSLYSENENFRFLKKHFFTIILTFIGGFTLNSDNYKGNLKFWTFLAFVGLHWPFWPLWPWMILLGKKWPLMIKIKHNWPVSNNQMSKPITKQVSAIWITVMFNSYKTWKKWVQYESEDLSFYILLLNKWIELVKSVIKMPFCIIDNNFCLFFFR